MELESKKPSGVTAFFFRGVVTLLPVVLTLVVFGLLFQMVNRYVTGPINAAIYWSLEGNALGWKALEVLGIDPLSSEYLATELLPLDLQSLATTSPEGFQDRRFQEALSLHRHAHLGFLRDPDELALRAERLRDDVKQRVHPLIGVVLSLLLVLWLGWLVGGFVGRRFMQHVDRTMTLIPVVKSVYPYSKQLVQFFFEKKKIEFDKVVAVPYPTPGSWGLAFITNGSLRSLDRVTGKELVCVFLPTSPMPMTGYTMFVETALVLPLPITIDEAVRIVMTGGVLLPELERVPRELANAAAAGSASFPASEPRKDSA
ncbi:MAG: DUF502 domain-containing protein [Planctomycetes bacterium]|nr:DUF502 domain-containing protein [Planctomycetota bacterium]